MRSRTHLISIIICATIIFFITGNVWGGTWADFNKPGPYGGTALYGIEGSNLVGCYMNIGFLYNNATDTLTTLKSPWSGQQGITYAQGISGNNVVGYYNNGINNPNHSFLYNNTTKNWTNLDYPGSTGTWATGIDGSRIVGSYADASGKGRHGFLYDITNSAWTTLDAPGSVITAGGGKYTYTMDIEGDIIVGNNIGNSGMRGFIYNITDNTWTTVANVEYINGIDGDKLVGCSGNQGMFYDGTNWTVLSYPGAKYTYANGISGDTIVGYRYVPHDYGDYAFVYTIPEPASALLIGAGLVFARLRRRYR